MEKNPLMEMTNEQLWQLFPVILEQHNPLWAVRYDAERAGIVQAMGGDAVLRISHIGSTAVAGLIAKPTIDILVEIEEDTDTGRLADHMEQAGYLLLPQPENPPPHMMFLKGYTPHGFDGQAYHVHVRYQGDWDEPYFCNYLSRHPAVAQEYGALKQALQKEFGHDRDAYTAQKTEFIRAVVKKARADIGGEPWLK